MNIPFRLMFGIVLVAVLFVFASWGAYEYAETLREQEFLSGYIGMAQYVGITIVAVVAAPVSTLPLVPIASMLWGGTIAALLSILGWLIGAVIAYELARGVGRPFIARHVDLSRAEQISHTLMGRNKHSQFWMLVLMRASLPVDVLSYAIGLFVPMSRSTYISATLIGIAPFAFVFAYAAELSPLYQIVTLAGAGVVMLIALWRVRTISREK